MASARIHRPEALLLPAYCRGRTAIIFLSVDMTPPTGCPTQKTGRSICSGSRINTLVLSLAYVGNHGLHGTIPLPFNTPQIATTQHAVNGQTVTYGFQPTDANNGVLLSEQFDNSGVGGTGGNADLRTRFLGYNPNSDFWSAVGLSHYNALEFSVTKRLSQGLQVNGSYTWSHSLDEQSGLGLFFNGNDPNNLRTAYGNTDYDRTHVLTISYAYQFPT